MYKKIKQRHPNLPVFSTVQYEHLRGIEDVSKPNAGLQVKAVKRLMRHSDLFAISTYRYGSLHPNPPSPDYFNLARSFGRPIAIAEMGAMSKTTRVFGIPLLASDTSQSEFIAAMLENAERYKFRFVINWVPVDINAMLPKLPRDVRKIAKAWVHTGLFDKRLNPKPAFALWQRSFDGCSD